jgi:hypothetical protein
MVVPGNFFPDLGMPLVEWCSAGYEWTEFWFAGKEQVFRMTVTRFPCSSVVKGVVEVWFWGSHFGFFPFPAPSNTWEGEARVLVVAEML